MASCYLGSVRGQTPVSTARPELCCPPCWEWTYRLDEVTLLEGNATHSEVQVIQAPLQLEQFPSHRDLHYGIFVDLDDKVAFQLFHRDLKGSGRGVRWMFTSVEPHSRSAGSSAPDLSAGHAMLPVLRSVTHETMLVSPRPRAPDLRGNNVQVIWSRKSDLRRTHYITCVQEELNLANGLGSPHTLLSSEEVTTVALPS